MSRTVKIIVGLLLIGVAVGIATGWFWSTQSEAMERVGQRIDTVEVDNDSGDVMIRASADVTETQIHERFNYRMGKPDTKAFEVEGSTLRLDGCGWWCSVDYTVIVPEGTKVVDEINSGDAELIDVASVTLESNSGNITVRGVAGPMTLDMNSGNIRGVNVSGNVTAETNSGDLVMAFAEPANVTAESNSGSISLTVPEAQYRVEGNTDSGDRAVHVPTSPNGDHLLVLESDSGDVAVRLAS